jgi:two-component system cell cycle sensor histidine kinase/response regulator CckA
LLAIDSQLKEFRVFSKFSSMPKKLIPRLGDSLPASTIDEKSAQSEGFVASNGRANGEIERFWDALPSVLWKLSARGMILEANKAALDFLGYTREQFQGRSVDEFLLSGLEFCDLAASVLPTGNAHGLPACLRCQDGSTRDVTIDAFSPDGGDIFYCAINDRSVQRRTEDHARAQAVFFEKPAEVMFTQTLEGIVIQWSSGAERFYGFKAAEVLGKKLPSRLAMPPDFFQTALRSVLQDGEWSGETSIVSAEGEDTELLMRWVLLHGGDGNPEAILVLSEDAAELRQLKEDRLRAHRHECVGTLAGGIAHDLNNVLQPVSMFLDLLRHRLPDAESREMLDAVEANLRRATELVRQILTFSSGVRTELRAVDIPELITEVANFIRPTFPKTIHLQVSVPENISSVIGNATQLEQVLLNFSVNARDAMPDGGRLKIDVSNFHVDEKFARLNPQSKAGDYVRITVSDTGHGIPRQLRKKIFEPFFTTKGPEKGTGLGLATAVGIIRNHGGFLTLDTEEGCGSSFHAFLPASTTRANSPSITKAPSQTPQAAGHGEAILLVDDESTVLKVMARSLEKSGYRVIPAEDGEQGFALYSQHQRDVSVVITDMAMPGMDGPALIAALKKLNPSVKIICTSGLGSSSGKNSVSELGVHAILSKPCNSRIILQAIEDALATSTLSS